MSLAPLHDLAVLAASAGEKSKTPFYIAGGVLAGWAFLVSFLGVRQPDFPGRLGGQRIVMAISVVLVLGVTTAAVATSSAPAQEGAAKKAEAPSSASTPAAPTSPPAAPAGGVTHLHVAADPQGQLSFDTQSLTATAGAVKVRFTNQSSVPHNFTIQQGTTTVAATPTINGNSTTLSTTLKPGTYTYLCTIPGHAQAGMKGTLTVS